MTQLPITLSDATGVPFYRQVVDQVAEMIQSGVLSPGTQLPSVRELAANLLVSLITVRRAYSDLETAGLIIRRQGYGTYVREDIQAAVQDRTRKEAAEVVTAALVRARQLGASERDIKAVIETYFNRKES